jgi:mercuric ion binding protein
MRQLFLALVATSAVAGLCVGRAEAGKVEVKGVHLCCGSCTKAVGATLKTVDGVTDAKCDTKTKTVTFTTKDEKATTAAVTALFASGFFGTATDDGKEVKVETETPKKGEKADEVVIKGVHACCPACQGAIKKTLPEGTKAAFGDKEGAQVTVTLTGKDLDKADILEALHKAGFNGKIEK